MFTDNDSPLLPKVWAWTEIVLGFLGVALSLLWFFAWIYSKTTGAGSEDGAEQISRLFFFVVAFFWGIPMSPALVLGIVSVRQKKNYNRGRVIYWILLPVYFFLLFYALKSRWLLYYIT